MKSAWDDLTYDQFGRVVMPDPTPEQIEEWRVANEDSMRRLLAGEFDYPDPQREKIAELERRIVALESEKPPLAGQ